MTLGASAYFQTATYWGSPVQGGFGDITFGAPVLVKCRWEDVTETFTDLSGQEKVSKAIVWTFDRLDNGGYLAKGDYATAPVADPTSLDNAHEIKRSDEIPDLRGLHYERRAYL